MTIYLSCTPWIERNDAGELGVAWSTAEVDSSKYRAVFFAGGHGTMWDFRGSAVLNQIASRVYESGGIVSAVCHGPAALVDVRLKDGSYLVRGKRVSAFTNAEEDAVSLSQVVPFRLESALRERGAIFAAGGLWQENAVIDERLVTGQNPASAKRTAEAVIQLLKLQDNLAGGAE